MRVIGLVGLCGVFCRFLGILLGFEGFWVFCVVFGGILVYFTDFKCDLGLV